MRWGMRLVSLFGLTATHDPRFYVAFASEARGQKAHTGFTRPC
jgi:hypothetical protein